MESQSVWYRREQYQDSEDSVVRLLVEERGWLSVSRREVQGKSYLSAAEDIYALNELTRVVPGEESQHGY